MDMERRAFALDRVAVERRADEAPIIRGHAAVFNQLSEDLGGWREKIAPGAFAEAVKNDDVRALFNHNPDFILGRNTAGTLRLAEDDDGLAIEIDPPDTTAGRDLLISLERGDVSQMSFGFRVRGNGGSRWEENEDGTVTRTLVNVSLFDVSPVVYPAYPQTDVGVRELRAFQELRNTKATGEQAAVMRRRLELIALT